MFHHIGTDDQLRLPGNNPFFPMMGPTPYWLEYTTPAEDHISAYWHLN